MKGKAYIILTMSRPFRASWLDPIESQEILLVLVLRLVKRLENLLAEPFARVTYTEAGFDMSNSVASFPY